MTATPEHAVTHGEIDERRFALSVIWSIIIAIPLVIVVIIGAVWSLTDADFVRAFSVGIWPAILTGAFGGGFVGVIIGSD